MNALKRHWRVFKKYPKLRLTLLLGYGSSVLLFFIVAPFITVGLLLMGISWLFEQAFLLWKKMCVFLLEDIYERLRFGQYVKHINSNIPALRILSKDE